MWIVRLKQQMIINIMFFYLLTGLAVPCDENCSKCNERYCQTCNQGFYWNNGCRSCKLDCRICTEHVCLTCQPKYLLQDSQCTKCYDNCATCFGRASNHCLSCVQGLTLTNRKYCILACHSDCSTCNGPDQNHCTSCNNPSNILGQGYCYNSCHSSCQSCDGPLFDHCLSCPAGSILRDEPALTCDSSCQTCYGNSEYNCLSCRIGSYRSVSYCLSCPDGCFACTLTANCLSCKDMLMSFYSQCYTACHEKCLTCRGGRNDDCLSCKAGYTQHPSGICIEQSYNSSNKESDKMWKYVLGALCGVLGVTAILTIFGLRYCRKKEQRQNRYADQAAQRDISTQTSQQQLDAEVQQCVICQCPLGQVQIMLQCKHIFHLNCIQQWKQQGRSVCPICLANI